MKKRAPIKIRLADDTVKTVLLDLTTTPSEAVDVLGEKLNLRNAEEYARPQRTHRPRISEHSTQWRSTQFHHHGVRHRACRMAHRPDGPYSLYSFLHRFALKTCEAPTGPPPAPLDQSRSLWENHVEQDAQLVLIVEN